MAGSEPLLAAFLVTTGSWLGSRGSSCHQTIGGAVFLLPKRHICLTAVRGGDGAPQRSEPARSHEPSAETLPADLGSGVLA